MSTDDLTVFGDWGTTRLRLTLFDGEHQLAQADGPGIGALTASAADTLLAALAPWRGRYRLERVVLCGMAGSRSGVIEAPYLDCPAGASDWAGQAASLALDGLSIRIAPGFAASLANGAPDVMRGEETQVFGALALRPELSQGDHWLVLPGTHSKWCHISDGRILSFQTFLTGELFALLSTRSSLLLGADRSVDRDAGERGFSEGLARAQEGRALSALFETRAAQLRARRSGAWAEGFLSGLMIGAEVAEAVEMFDVQAATLVGASSLIQRYRPALQGHGLSVETLSGEDCVLAGLRLLAGKRS